MTYEFKLRARAHAEFPSGGRLGEELDRRTVSNLGLPTLDELMDQPAQATQEKLPQTVEAKPFILGDALPVVPARIVRKIQIGEFVDMAELLKDNMEAEARRAAIEGEVQHQLVPK